MLMDVVNGFTYSVHILLRVKNLSINIVDFPDGALVSIFFLNNNMQILFRFFFFFFADAAGRPSTPRPPPVRGQTVLKAPVIPGRNGSVKASAGRGGGRRSGSSSNDDQTAGAGAVYTPCKCRPEEFICSSTLSTRNAPTTTPVSNNGRRKGQAPSSVKVSRNMFIYYFTSLYFSKRTVDGLTLMIITAVYFIFFFVEREREVKENHH